MFDSCIKYEINTKNTKKALCIYFLIVIFIQKFTVPILCSVINVLPLAKHNNMNSLILCRNATKMVQYQNPILYFSCLYFSSL